MVERSLRMRQVAGSMPTTSTLFCFFLLFRVTAFNIEKVQILLGSSFFSMYDEFEEQSLEGLNEKIMSVVKSYQGDYSEVEVLKKVIIQSNLLLATYNVRYYSLLCILL